jgi:hypothetical protein
MMNPRTKDELCQPLISNDSMNGHTTETIADIMTRTYQCNDRMIHTLGDLLDESPSYWSFACGGSDRACGASLPAPTLFESSLNNLEAAAIQNPIRALQK